MIYAETTTYSPVADCQLTRLSTVDDSGREFFCLVSRETKKWRDRRKSALTQMEKAIDRGDQPGEVSVELDS